MGANVLREEAPVAVETRRPGSAGRSAVPDPVFILAPPCTFSWVVCASLGQHPELYGLPELHLFTADTVGDWWELSSRATFEMDHGLVRAVAELFFGGQSETAVSRARGWLRRRAHFTTGLLLETIAERVQPLRVVEKSPSTTYSAVTLQRALDLFPDARFVHLVSHPRLYCEAVLEILGDAVEANELPPSHWLVRLASGPASAAGDAERQGELDPQVGWLTAHRTIAEFLTRVPPENRRLVRGESLLEPETDELALLAAWLGVRTDAEAVEEMRHPERSPFARLGPPSAAFGSDRFLRPGPLVRPEWSRARSLEGPLGWRRDGREFLTEVGALARELGYA
jgi:hypothetical protein